jgi:hypothetical protein
MYLFLLIRDLIGTAEYSAMSLLLSGIFYIFNPILFFIVLYSYCGGPLLNRIASVLISIIFGSMLGYWIGYVGGTLVLTVFSEGSASNIFSNVIPFLTQYVIGQMLASFAVLAFSDLVPRWRDSLPTELQATRPGGLVLLVTLYCIFALLNLLALPILSVYTLSTTQTPIQSLAFVLLISTLVLATVGQFVLAAGLYLGKKWAWVLAVISSGSGVFIDVTVMGALVVMNAAWPVGLIWLVFGTFIAFLISLAVLLYLLSVRVRLFFGFVNPTA